MLDAYIIEEIKRQDEERRRQEERDRPRLHIEIDRRTPPRRPPGREPDDHEREEEIEEPSKIEIGLA